MPGKEWKTGYKALSMENDRFMSFTGGKLATALEYITDQETRPNKGDGPCAVFSELEDAVHFIADNPTLNRCPVIAKCSYLESNHSYLWRRINQRLVSWDATLLPQGTVLADAVILRERVS